MEENIILINPRELHWHERVKLRHAAYIFFKMVFSRKFGAPILIDLKTKTILDGHHRCYAANRIRLKKVPCRPINYLEDDSVKVYSRRTEVFVDKKEVLRVALSENIFPHKTTRHEYKVQKFKSIKINELKK